MYILISARQRQDNFISPRPFTPIGTLVGTRIQANILKGSNFIILMQTFQPWRTLGLENFDVLALYDFGHGDEAWY